MAEELTDEQAINKAVDMLKEKGIFDQIRKNCLEDINTKSSFLNLNQRIEGYVNKFLKEQNWDTNLNKNQLRERLRKDINSSTSIKSGITHLAEQVINPLNFETKIEEQIKELLGIEEDEIKNEIEQDFIKNENLDKLEELSDDDKLISDVSDDEDENLFLNKAGDELNNNGANKIKSERELDNFEKNLDSFLSDKLNDKSNDKSNDKLSPDNLVRIKTEKYESSISSNDDLDCMD